MAVRHENRSVSVKANAATLVARNTGYRVSAAHNAARDFVRNPDLL